MRRLLLAKQPGRVRNLGARSWNAQIAVPLPAGAAASSASSLPACRYWTSTSQTADAKDNSSSGSRYKNLNSRQTENAAKSGGPLPVNGKLRSKLRRVGAIEPTNVQSKAFPIIRGGGDILAVSPRGSGKTLAYLLPMLELIDVNPDRLKKVAVVLTPSRVVAEKTYLMVNRLRERNVKVALVHDSGGSQAYQSQLAWLQQGVHIVVGTPARVMQLLNHGAIQPESVSTVVLDDVEELLRKDGAVAVMELMKYIANSTPQTLLFAGSLPPWLQDEINNLCPMGLQRIDSVGGSQIVPPNLKHASLQVPSSQTKRARSIAWLLERVLEAQPSDGQARRILIFASSRADVSMLSSHTSLKHRSLALHAEMPTQERDEMVSMFHASTDFILVTTDDAARGVKMPVVQTVLHMSPPSSIEEYATRLVWSAIPTKGAACDVSPKSASDDTGVHNFDSVILHGPQHHRQLREFEKVLHQQVDAMTPPDEEILRRSAVAAIARELSAATLQYDVEAFGDDAQQQLELNGPRLLAAALVLLERRKRAEEWVSPLSGRPRYTPLLFVNPFLEHLRTRQAVAAAVDRACRAWQNSRNNDNDEPKRKRGSKVPVGRIELTAQGWVVDVPQASVPAVLQDPWLKDKGVSIVPLAKLPRILGDVGIAAESAQDDQKRSRRRRSPRQNLQKLQDHRDKKTQLRSEFMYPSGRRTLFGKLERAGKPDRAKEST